MTEKSCETCAFFAPWQSIYGRCKNPRNATVKHVGGGGEYSSSELCPVAIPTQVNMICDHYEPARPANVRLAYEMAEVPRSPELKPWEPTPWARVDAR